MATPPKIELVDRERAREQLANDYAAWLAKGNRPEVLGNTPIRQDSAGTEFRAKALKAAKSGNKKSRKS